MLGISLDVVGRTFFLHPLDWVYEFTEYALLSVPFLAMAWLVRQKAGHIQIDIILELVPGAWQSTMRAVASMIAAGVCLFTGSWALLAGFDNLHRDVMTVGIHPIPKAVLIFIICFGFVLTGVEFIRRAYSEWGGNTEFGSGEIDFDDLPSRSDQRSGS